MEQQTILENLEGLNSSNSVSSILLPSRSKILCSCGCGTLFEERDNRGRKRRYIHGHRKKGINYNIKILEFSNEQNQIILGSLLGDSYIIKHKYSYMYGEEHCHQQKNYLSWKNEYLKFHFNYYEKRNNYKINKSNPIFKKYYNLFYPNNIKIITREILDKLKPLALAVLYIDDGSYSYWDRRINIYTQCFGLEGNKIIQKWLKEKWGVDCKISKDKRKERNILGKKIKVCLGKRYFLNFNVENTKKFIKLIKLYILQMPKNMRYKIGMDEERKESTKKKQQQKGKNYYLKNKEKINKKFKIYYQKNKDKWKIYNKNKKSLKLNNPISNQNINKSNKCNYNECTKKFR